MLLEISNKKENYLNNLGLLKASKLRVKNSLRLVTNNDRYKFNVKSISDDLDERNRKKRSVSSQSSKVNRITLGKNQQEEKLLAFRKRQIEKSSEIEDNQWLHEIIDLKDFMNDIKRSASCRSTPDNPMALKSLQSYSRNQSRRNQINLYNLVKNVRSYTSMVGSDNDKNREELKERLHRPSVVFQDDVDFYDEEGYKSVRRPLRRMSSVWLLQFRRKSLQNKIDFFREEKKKNFHAHDRNVRYGDPLPRTAIYRHLRLVSKVEESIIR